MGDESTEPANRKRDFAIFALLLSTGLMIYEAGFPPVPSTFLFFIVSALSGVFCLRFRLATIIVPLLSLGSICITYRFQSLAHLLYRPAGFNLQDFWPALWIGCPSTALVTTLFRARLRWIVPVLILIPLLYKPGLIIGLIVFIAICVLGYFMVGFQRASSWKQFAFINAWATALAGSMLWATTGGYLSAAVVRLPWFGEVSLLAGTDFFPHPLLGASIGAVVGLLGWMSFRPVRGDLKIVSETLQEGQRIRQKQGGKARAIFRWSLALSILFALSCILSEAAFIFFESLRCSAVVDDHHDAKNPVLRILSDGRMIFGWTNTGALYRSESGIFFRILDGGNKFGPVMKANREDIAQAPPRIAVNRNDDFTMVWSKRVIINNLYGNRIAGRRFDRNGKPLGDEFVISPDENTSSSRPDVAMGDDGRFIVTWFNYDKGIVARLYNPSGEPISEPRSINETSIFKTMYPTVMAAGGRFIVAWENLEKSGGETNLYARILNEEGNAASPEIRVNLETVSWPVYADAAVNSKGEFLVAWMREMQREKTAQLRVRKFDSGGRGLEDEMILLDYQISEGGDRPSVILKDDGSFGVVYQAQSKMWGWLTRLSATSAPFGRLNLRMYGSNGVPTWSRKLDSALVAYRWDWDAAASADGIIAVDWQEGIDFWRFSLNQIRIQIFATDGSPVCY